uniref:CSON007586 protein n=1 Tax=Culicoides sonorensis TaxID=179676 RepID=A0A336LAZ1_CULSO
MVKFCFILNFLALVALVFSQNSDLPTLCRVSREEKQCDCIWPDGPITDAIPISPPESMDE